MPQRITHIGGRIPSSDQGASETKPAAEKLESELSWNSRLALVERICASDGFRRAEKLQGFLRFVCAEAAAGRSSQIKEQQIGTAVFRRKPGYNMSDDNIVRVEARRLRQRLEAYFNGDGADEPCVLTVPRGGYVPSFAPRPQRPPAPQPPPVPVAPSPPSWRQSRRRPRGCGDRCCWRRAWRCWPSSQARAHGGASAPWGNPPTRPLTWRLAALPEPARLAVGEETLIVLSNPRVLLYRAGEGQPSDGGVAIPTPSSLHAQLAGALNNEEASAGRHYLQASPSSYTGIGEAASSFHLGGLMQRLGIAARLTQGRFLTWEGARNRNLIVLGSPHINDWTLDNLPRGGFRFVAGGVESEAIEGAAGEDGEPARFYSTETDAAGRLTVDHGVMSLLPFGDAKALILAGRTSAGTYGVGELFANAERMHEILDRLRERNGGEAPEAWQALLRVAISDNLPVETRLLGVRAVVADH